MISIIIPTLNEESTIHKTIEHVFSMTGLFEVIVVDGGSKDNTINIIEHDNRISIIRSEKGRALQMNVGAKNARGEILLFLHADTSLPKHALEKINELMHDSTIKAGGFLQKFSGNDWRLRLISKIDNYRCRRSKIFYGDQALFIRTSLFNQLNGFPEQSILEDWKFGQSLRQVTTPAIINDPVITDSRKFEKVGIWTSFMRITVILTRLKFGLPISNQHPFFHNIR